MSKHTPGPWYIRYCDDDYNHNECMTVISSKDYGTHNRGTYNDGPDTIAIVHTPYLSADMVESITANARLIAAAPDLLSALETMLKASGFGDPITKTSLPYHIAKAAIAKAKGEE